jgi:hypothetical protein
MLPMSVASLPWWVGAAFVLQAVVVYLVARLINRRQTRAVILELANNVAHLEDQLADMAALAEGNHRKFNQQFERIAGYLRERDEWQALYFQQASEHGTAQAMMMTERQRLVLQLERAKIQPKINPAIEAVARAFDETHAGPARVALSKRAEGKVTESEGQAERE